MFNHCYILVKKNFCYNRKKFFQTEFVNILLQTSKKNYSLHTNKIVDIRGFGYKYGNFKNWGYRFFR